MRDDDNSKKNVLLISVFISSYIYIWRFYFYQILPSNKMAISYTMPVRLKSKCPVIKSWQRSGHKAILIYGTLNSKLTIRIKDATQHNVLKNLRFVLEERLWRNEFNSNGAPLIALLNRITLLLSVKLCS